VLTMLLVFIFVRKSAFTPFLIYTLEDLHLWTFKTPILTELKNPKI